MNIEDNMIEFEFIEASDDQNWWRYIVCWINIGTNKAYMSNLIVNNIKEVIKIF